MEQFTMNPEQQEALLQGLKASQINYRYSTKDGGITETELSFWQVQLCDLSAREIAKGFHLHIQNSKFFPTVSDIRNANHLYRNGRTVADQWNKTPALPAPESSNPKGMSPKAKEILNRLMTEARKDPKVKAALERKERATRRRENYSKPSVRHITPRTSRMTEAEMNEIYYKETANAQ